MGWQELLPGLKVRRGKNKYVTALLHFTADPDGKTETERREGLSPEDFEREHNLSFAIRSGKPVYQDFNPAVHLSSDIFYTPSIPVWRGWDFGFHRPAVSYSQILGDGGWWILGEFLGSDISLPQFLEENIFPYQKEFFPDARFVDCADPAGMQVTDKSEHSSFAILATRGIYPLARKSEIKEGLLLIRNKLYETTEGKSGLKIHSEKCPILVEGFKGGYGYPETKPGKPELELPKKDGYFDHLMDTLRYKVIHAYSLWPKKPKKPQQEKTLHEKLIEKHSKPQTVDFQFEEEF